MKGCRLFVLLSLVLTFATAKGQSVFLDIESGVNFTRLTQRISNLGSGHHVKALLNLRKESFNFKIGVSYLSQNTLLDNSATTFGIATLNVPVSMGFVHRKKNFRLGCHAGFSLGNIIRFTKTSSNPGESENLTNSLPARQHFSINPISLDIGRAFDFGDIYFKYSVDMHFNPSNPYTQGRFISQSLGIGLSLKLTKEETQEAPAEP